MAHINQLQKHSAIGINHAHLDCWAVADVDISSQNLCHSGILLSRCDSCWICKVLYSCCYSVYRVVVLMVHCVVCTIRWHSEYALHIPL
jgi:hypothetical protein